MINFCIVHYNTPELTECLIYSINKFVGQNCHIYIFDNSDKLPFTYRQDNITIFDNTKGQIIDFDKWLATFPNKNREASGKYISARHCISVEKCFELINDNFILLDSDILLTKNISDIWNNDYVYIGEVETWSGIQRLLPFMCFINVKYCLKNNIHYFYAQYMHGISQGTGNLYDTGGAFYKHTKNLKHLNIQLKDYIVHYRSGSWAGTLVKPKPGKIKAEDWLLLNKQYWADVSAPKHVIYTCITGNYERLVNPSFISDDFKYICFTDNPKLVSPVWECRPIPEELKNLSPIKQQRLIKICPHKYLPEFETSIWVDGSVNIINDMTEFLNQECTDTNKSVFIPAHPDRKCIYQEAKMVIYIKKDKLENVLPQIEKYYKEKFPINAGLVQSNIIIRKHNDPYCIKLMELWASELLKGSHRDLLSFNYALWKIGDTGFQYLDKNLSNSKYFKWYPFHNQI